MKIDIPKKLKELCSACDHPVYIVGGYVRNSLAGLPRSPDIDICGSASAAVFAGLAKITPVNKKLGTALIEYKGEKYEYTQFRSEQYDGSGTHTPSVVHFTDSLKQDAIRRDFTANSIYYDIKNESLADPLGGAGDILNKRLKSYDALKIFASDGLRLMRLVRLSAELGFDIDPDTYRAAAENKHRLSDIAAERKREELERILRADLRYGVRDAHYKGLKLLYSLGLFRYILPSIEAMEVAQNPKYHAYNVLEHTFMAVRYAEPDVRLAALMHDTGKPVSLKKDGNMYGHALESEIIVKKELGQNGLKYPSEVVKETAELVRLHMYDLKRNTSEGKMRIFVAENLCLIEKLQKLVIADGLATGQTEPIPPRFMYFKQKLISENAPLSLKDLKIDGKDALNAGLKDGQIKTALAGLLRECILNPRLNNREWLLKHLFKN